MDTMHRAYVDVYAKKTNYCAKDDYEEEDETNG